MRLLRRLIKISTNGWLTVFNHLPPAATPAASYPNHPTGDTAGWSSTLSIDDVRHRLGRRHKVSASALRYIGQQDERHTVGRIIHLFNIMDPLHWRYRSTVAFVEVVRCCKKCHRQTDDEIMWPGDDGPEDLCQECWEAYCADEFWSAVERWPWR
jgi:hypothetical protein